jgi:hypothetical protein
MKEVPCLSTLLTTARIMDLLLLKTHILFYQLSSNRMIEITVFQVGVLGKLGTVFSLVEQSIQWSYELHAALFSDELDDLGIDGFIGSLQAHLLPSETDISVTNRGEVVQLVHLGNQMVWKRFSVCQAL